MDKNILIGIIILSLVVMGSTFNYLSISPQIIKVGYLPSDHHAALFAAKELEMFEKEGLKVQLVPFNSGADLVEAAEQGKIDIGYCGISPVTMAIDGGAPLKVVAPVNLEGSGIVVSKSSNISTAQNLSGNTVALPRKGSIQDILLHIYLENNKINPENVKMIEYEVPMMPLGLKEGSFDAYIAWEPFVSSGKNYKIGNVLAYSHEIWSDHPCCVVVARDDFIKNKPLTLSKFLIVHVKATEYINKNPEKNIGILSKKMGSLSDVEREGLNNIQYISLPDPQFNANVLKMVEIQKKLGYVKHDLTYDQIFDFRYLPS